VPRVGTRWNSFASPVNKDVAMGRDTESDVCLPEATISRIARL
jgi:hypothetical protein